MTKIVTSITLDPSLKKEAQELFTDLGLDMSTAVSMFLSQAVREQSLPFYVQRYQIRNEKSDQ